MLALRFDQIKEFMSQRLKEVKIRSVRQNQIDVHFYAFSASNCKNDEGMLTVTENQCKGVQGLKPQCPTELYMIVFAIFS